MTRRTCTAFQQRLAASTAILSVALGATLSSTAFAAAGDYPITGQQRETAQKVAEAGVPLSELAPNAPDSYTVKTGDTLWDISKLYLRSPWRWPELWGMNLEQIRNPHLIYPGQVLVLEKTAGRARLRLAQPAGEPPSGTVKLSPHVRPSPLDSGAIASIPFHLIEPFLNEAVIFQGNELLSAPRIVATQEGRVLLSRGDTAYVRGEIGSNTAFRIFSEAKPLKDPSVLPKPCGRARRALQTTARPRSCPPPSPSRASAKRPTSAIGSPRCRSASSRTTRRMHRLHQWPARSSRCTATR